MKTKIIAAGLAAALGLTTPMVAEAAVVDLNAGATVQLARNGGYGHGHGHGYGHGHYDGPRGYYGHRAPPVVVHRPAPRPWSYWRPRVVERHYYVVGQPTYYSTHPSYGPYYRVRARDNNDVLLWLGISAITGAILFSNY